MNPGKKLLFQSFLVLLSSFFICSCEKDLNKPDLPAVSTLLNGVFICNEGPFMSGTGTVSFLDNTSGTLSNSIFELVNNRPLGNIVQSMEVVNGLGYIIVNNADKIEVVGMENFQSVGKIENLTLPRFMIAVDERRAYVSCWDNTVAVINLLTLTVEKRIPVQNGPERLLTNGSRVFVLNQGGFGIDSTVTVINSVNDKVITNLAVYPKPTGAVIDKNSNLWVMCSGRGFNGWPADDDTEGHLLCIDPLSLDILKDIPFPDHFNHPEKLVINAAGDVLYYLYKNSVFQFNISSAVLETEAMIPHQGFLYTLGLDPRTDLLYVSDPVDFVQNGWVFRYHSSTGLLLDSLKAGIIPTYFCFPE